VNLYIDGLQILPEGKRTTKQTALDHPARAIYNLSNSILRKFEKAENGNLTRTAARNGKNHQRDEEQWAKMLQKFRMLQLLS
jgi:hypothetical protein